jgi:hypothetical protein
MVTRPDPRVGSHLDARIFHVDPAVDDAGLVVPNDVVHDPVGVR